ncbi:Ig-like domain-containing protein [Sinomonas sp. JGH33]|uniref:Ig-like domain-containing protein n=1 Tax=Sinomonas terricola TaxID=3110330 RepID=A0ABU5T1J8_9MICC|nr:Ig-like domain-containing protein [Sinomonas sp. JGH33]MEA5453525.1 Ig-like domain-containing protein [Sinomonas sp. JGH33]
MRAGELRRHARTLITGTAMALVATVIVVAAVLYPGFRSVSADLNDGGIWVTNSSMGLVGHLNFQSKTLDGGVASRSPKFDVVQQGKSVAVSDAGASTLSPVDPANVRLTQDLKFAGSDSASFGTTTAALADPDKGLVWAVPLASLATFNPDTTAPAVEDVKGVAATVTTGNEILAVAPQRGEIVRVAEGGTAKFSPIDGLSQSAKAQIAAVGDSAVVLDPDSGTLFLPGGAKIERDDFKGAALQQSGPSADSAAVATATGLVMQPLGGGNATVTPASDGTGQGPAQGRAGQPARPVQQGGCVHSAWSGSAIYLRVCAGAAPLAKAVPSAAPDTQLVFRTNRDLVVLNDVRGGNVWLVTDKMQLVNNWQEIVPQKVTKNGDREDSADITLQRELPDRKGENHPPLANPDDFGVRAGRTVILPVLLNDTDPDGDVLTAKLAGADPKIGHVQPIFNGAALQVVVNADAQGADTFDYEVSDGRGGVARTRVTLTVRDSSQNSPPKAVRATTLAAEQGATVSQNILGDWVDPDGDDMFLTGASTTGDGDSVRFQADGTVIFQDGGKSIGKKSVTVLVSDSRDATTATITVDVRPHGTLAPQTTADHVRTGVNEPIVVSPLANDIDPSGTGLRLLRVEPVAGLDIVMNSEDGTFSARAATPGVYYAVYLASNGSGAAKGLVRIDVDPPATGSDAPIAVRAIGLLPAGGNVLVDPLANDTDPGGGVLVLQSIAVPADAPISVAVVNHQVLRITDVRGLKEPLTFTYVISNGDKTASSTVTVIPIPPPAKLHPPVAKDDQAVVRAGDTVTIPVLANDSHPDNAQITLDPKLVETPDPAMGHLWVDQDKVRFTAGSKTGTVQAVYSVIDPAGQKDSAKIMITIKAADPSQNANPVPKNITARVLAGQTAKIAVPVDGIDPDGDSASITGLEKAPQLGTAIIKDGYIEYTATADAHGKDTFTYVVEDRFGGRGVATVLVGVAPVPSVNHNPVAADDRVSVRPGRPVSVDALANDTDPDGDTIHLATDGFEVPPDTTAKAANGRVVITPPSSSGTYTVRYTITDGRGGRGVGNIVVSVDPNAPLQAPIARDVHVNAMDVAGKANITVDVLKDAEDPDGLASELKVSLPVSGGAAVDGRTVKISLTPEPQEIPFTLTDIDGLTGSALVWVPGLKDQRPVLKSLDPITVKAGEKSEIKLSDYVAVRGGHAPRITTEDSVHAVAADGSALVKDAGTLTYTARKDYAGHASITFEATDGSSPDDPDGHKSTLTLPIEVQPASDRPNTPPTIAASTLEVAQKEPPATLDLKAATTDPDPGDIDRMAYRITSQIPAGLKVTLDGATLTASADGAPKGTNAQMTIEADDGRAKSLGTVTVAVVGSTRPLAVANPDSVPDAKSGQPVEIPVLANDSNPFPDTPLKVTSASVNGGAGTATVDGDRILVTPAAGFHGQLSGLYHVQDATGDPDREVVGQFTVTVRDRPDAPSAPVVDGMASRQVTLHWAPPANNGAEITQYKVQFAGGSQSCPTTTCTITGLANGTQYTFSIVAANAVGDSPASASSAPITPDARPSQPAPPTLTRGDQKITLAWTPPANEGTPISSYVIELSSAQGIQQKTVGAVTSLEWTGLTNGVEYRARIQAKNGAKDPSDFSAYSAPAKPAGVPLAPSAPAAARTTSAIDGGVADVSWASEPLKDNGEPVTGYVVKVYRNGAYEKSTPQTSSTTQRVTGLDTSSTYTFTLTSVNAVGPSPESPKSPAVVPYGRPGAVNNLSASPTNTSGSGHQVQLSYTAPSSNGNSISGYQYSTDGGTSWNQLASNNVVSGLSNGQNYSFTVRAVNAAGPGLASNSAGANPYGAPLTPVVSASQNGIRVDMRWNTGGYDNGRPTTVSVTIDGSPVANDGAQTVGNGPDQAHSITVRACITSEPSNCTSNTASARTASPSATLSQGPRAYDPQCTSNACYYFDVRGYNFHPNSTVTVQCWNDSSPNPHVFASYTDTTDANGYFRNNSHCFLGRASINPWSAGWATITDSQGSSARTNNSSW